jgi:hypothetical protein
MRPKAKRSRMDLDTSELNKSLETFMSEFESKDKVTNKDLMNAMLTMMKHVMEVNSHCQKLALAHEEFEDKIFNFIDKAEASEKKINILEQKEVNSDLYLSNFPVKPDTSTICDNLSQLLEFPREKIKSAYAFPLSRKPPPQSSPHAHSQTTYSVVIKLSDESTKIEALKKKKDRGMIKLEQLVPTIAAKFKDFSIPTLSRLTKFNNAVVNRLIKARAEKKVEIFQLRNGLFRFKSVSADKWTYVGTEYELQEFCKEFLGIIPAEGEDENLKDAE